MVPQNPSAFRNRMRGASSVRLTAAFFPPAVLITTYEYVMLDKQALGKTKWKYIIVDEVKTSLNPPQNCVKSR